MITLTRAELRAKLMALTECYPDNLLDEMLVSSSALARRERHKRDQRIDELLDLLLGPAPAVPTVGGAAGDMEVPGGVGPSGR